MKRTEFRGRVLAGGETLSDGDLMEGNALAEAGRNMVSGPQKVG